MSSRTNRFTRRAAALPLAASLLLAGAAPALADGATYTLELRQNLPRTATSDEGGVPQEGREGCPGIPDGKDGWHFVLPGNSTDFVELTVTFEPGGQQVITDFGPPSEKHAYVASEPGAELVSAQAEVEGDGKELELFNLSHTCPAEGTSGEEPTGEPSDEPTEEPTDGSSEEPTDEPAPGESEGTPTSPEPTSTEQPGSDSSTAPVAGGAEGGVDGDLAETGSGAPVGALAAGAAALVGVGGYLVLRRRKAAAQQD